jgi:hypothetical protein
LNVAEIAASIREFSFTNLTVAAAAVMAIGWGDKM